MTPARRLLGCGVAMLLWGIAAGEKQPFAEFMPPGIRLGLTKSELQELRPAALVVGTPLMRGTSRDSNADDLELVEQLNGSTMGIFGIRSGKVALVVIGAVDLPMENPSWSLPTVTEIAAILKRRYQFSSSFTILRIIDHPNPTKVKVETWTAPEIDHQLLFVATPRETSVYLIDSGLVRPRDLFSIAPE